MTSIRIKNTVNTVYFLALFIFDQALDSSLSSLSRTLKSKTGIRKLERSGVQSIFILIIVFGTSSVFSKKVLFFLVPPQVLARFYCQNLRRYQKKQKCQNLKRYNKNKQKKIFLSSGLGASKT